MSSVFSIGLALHDSFLYEHCSQHTSRRAMDGHPLRFGRYSASYRKRLLQGAELVGDFLKKNGLTWKLVLKGQPAEVDILLDNFLSQYHAMHSQQPGRLQLAKHGILFCQVSRPQLRSQLKQSWSTLKAWEEQMPGKLRPPLPIAVMMGMLCEARILAEQCSNEKDRQKWLVFSALVMTSFFGLLRPGELLNLRRRHVGLPNHVTLALPCVTLCLEKPKNFRQLGLRQFVSIKHPSACEWLSWTCSLLKQHDDKLWPHSHAEFRRMFKVCTLKMKVGDCHFTPASLRASGATFLFDEEEDVARPRLIGRWSNIQSLEHYVQTGKSQQMLQSLSTRAVRRLELLLKQGGFLLDLPVAARNSLPKEHILDIPRLDLDEQLWKACRGWGRTQTKI